MLPHPSIWGEQDWEEILPLENREDMETMKKFTQNHVAKGLPSNDTDWLQAKEGKPKMPEMTPMEEFGRSDNSVRGRRIYWPAENVGLTPPCTSSPWLDFLQLIYHTLAASMQGACDFLV